MNQPDYDDLDDYFPRDRPFEPEPAPAQEKKKSGRDYGSRGEVWVKKYLGVLCGASLTKRNDAPTTLPDGTTIYPNRGVDFYGSMNIPGATWAAHMEVEVKTFEDSWPISDLKEWQVKFLTQSADRGEMALLALAERRGYDIVKMWFIPWPWKLNGEFTVNGKTIKTFAWFMKELRKRATGGFQAKSIRQQDQDLLVDFLVEKRGQKWSLSATHWMRALVGQGGLL